MRGGKLELSECVGGRWAISQMRLSGSNASGVG